LAVTLALLVVASRRAPKLEINYGTE